MPFERYIRRLLMTKQRLPRWSWKHYDACFHVRFPLKFTLVVQNLRVVLLFNDILTLILFFFVLGPFVKFQFVFNFIIGSIIMICYFFKFGPYSFFFIFFLDSFVDLIFFQFHSSNQNSKLSSHLFFITHLVLIFLITIVCFFYPFI